MNIDSDMLKEYLKLKGIEDYDSDFNLMIKLNLNEKTYITYRTHKLQAYGIVRTENHCLNIDPKEMQIEMLKHNLEKELNKPVVKQKKLKI